MMPAKFDNSGSLSKNDRKEKPTHKDYTGSATVAGVEYWLSGWIKDGERGKWLSLAFTPKEQPEEKPATRRVQHNDNTPDDDLPF